MPEIRGEITGDATSFVRAIERAERALDGLSDEGEAAAKNAQKQSSIISKAWGAIGSALKTTAVAAAAAGAALAGAAAVATAKAINASREHERVANQLNAVLKSTKGVARVSADAIAGLANELSRTTNFSNEMVTSASNVLLTFTKISGSTFPQAIKAATDMAAALGTDLQSSIIQVGKALNDPIAGVSALAEAGIQFSESQKKMIESLVRTGQTAKAQQIILKELETQFKGSAEAQRDSFVVVGNALNDLAVAYGETFRPAAQLIADRFIPVLDNLRIQFSALAQVMGPKLVELASRMFDFASQTGNSGTVILDILASITAGIVSFGNTVQSLAPLAGAVAAGFGTAFSFIKLGFATGQAAAINFQLAVVKTVNFVLVELDRMVGGFARIADGFERIPQAVRDLLPKSVQILGEFASALAGPVFSGIVKTQDALEGLRKEANEANRALEEAANDFTDIEGKFESGLEAADSFGEGVLGVADSFEKLRGELAAAIDEQRRLESSTNAATAALNRQRAAAGGGGQAAGDQPPGSVLVGGAGASSGGFVQGPFVVTGAGLRPVDPKTGKIEGFQLGGPVQSSGLIQAEAGEFVLNRSAAGVLGPQLLAALNRISPSVNVGGITINAGGPGQSDRAFARSLIPEIERALSRGIKGAMIG